VLERARALGVAAAVVGDAGGTEFAVRGLFELPVTELRVVHEDWLPRYMHGDPAAEVPPSV
jgi:phosphoribosylformylglycinamidine synthase